jgi:hypothetical protein
MMKIWAVMAAAVLLVACDDGGGAGDDDATAEVCTGGVDDDGDGMIDCADSDCAANAACTAGGEVCDDHSDNDGDMMTDCSDSDCASAKSARGVASCAPGTFGDFEGNDGPYGSGSGDCAFTEGFIATILLQLTVGGIVFPVLGDNADAFFAFDSGSTSSASGTGFNVLGFPDHDCTVTITGTAVKTITITCTNAQGGSCSMTYSFAG